MALKISSKVRWKTLFCITFILIIALFCKERKPVEKDNPVIKFKERIDFPDNKQMGTNTGIVYVDWHVVIKEFMDNQQLWETVDRKTYFFQHNIMAFNCVLHGGDKNVVIDIYATDNHSSAMQVLLNLASQTTMEEIPYTLPKEKIGDFTIIPVAIDYPLCIWVYKNICGKISMRTGTCDVIAVAKNIQNSMEQNVLKQIQIFPLKLTDPNAISSTISVGKEVEIAFEQEDSTYGYYVKSFDISKSIEIPGVGVYYDSNETIEIQSIDNHILKVKGLKPGPAKVALSIGNPKTLLSNSVILDIDVITK